MTDELVWVVGRGGLLGRNTEQSLARRHEIWQPATALPWNEHSHLLQRLRMDADTFVRRAAGRRWRLAWCAGAGVVGTRPADLRRETEALSTLLQALSVGMEPVHLRSGALFLASSAGGVYAGVEGPPYDEWSPVRPLGDYGWNKLAQEEMVTAWSDATGVPVLIGRIANLYGPGQKLDKQQGIVTMVCRRVLERQPFVLYVPLDTIRDYLYVSDCGAMVSDGLDRLRREPPVEGRSMVTIKILASQRPTTIGTVLAEVRRVTNRNARVVIAGSGLARQQAPDLRMRSVVWPELDRRPLATLGEGVHTIVTDLIAKMSAATVSGARGPA